MTTTALMTELEALNLMLTVSDEAPVQTLEVTGHLPLSIARGILNQTSRVVQSTGWAFNTERCYPLSRDIDGRIPLAPNTLSMDVDERYSDLDAIQRGLWLYDRHKHTYKFTQDLTGTVIVLLPWDELPQAARHYIAIRAARTLQGRLLAGDLRATELEEQIALNALQSYEADSADANFLTDSVSVSGVLLYRET